MPVSTVEPVELAKAYRLLNHGPTVLVSSAHGARRNVMAAAWCMPLDFDPPKLLVVIDKSTFTRELIDASGEFAINVPTQAQRALTVAVGSDSGRDRDKFAALDISTFTGDTVAAPLIAGCVAWLECRVVPENHIQSQYDLFIGEVVAARADSRVFSAGRWHFSPEHDALRTLHHVAGGAFFVTGPMTDGDGD
ncbi:flavin reductase family protein [Methyloversatilis sp.]|uniref:flavin reductase family protein n=1 Tax=Methyloversatilis sp. TaxID=2569862 RepID=UPI0027338FC6|nr:flavin reductase family protein [Methyloversatilis sp.]MDP2869071.1 flavin reductase family protein [Methyloversatilis sp.]MDP3453894.1 flavin reductase family protein [Methyloversatilis sp.]MDP3579024.1 flavin reductase family protein [Methyloversatilis sp.]